MATAWACKMAVAYAYTSLRGDKSLYMLLGQDFVQNGLLREAVHSVETGRTVYNYMPAATTPFYSFLSGPLLAVFRPETLSLLLDGVAWAVAITGLYRLGRTVLAERWQVAVFVLLAGLFYYPHELSSTPKDGFALGFSLWMLYLGGRFVQSRLSVAGVVGLTLFAVLLAVTKLLYIPLPFLLFTVLFFTCLLRKRWYHALVSVGMSVTVSGILWLLNQTMLASSRAAATTGLALASDAGRQVVGFFPENLRLTYPFITGSFFNLDFVGVQIERWLPVTYSGAIQAFRYADVLLAVVLIAAAVRFRRVLRQRRFVVWLLPTIGLALCVLAASMRFKSITSLGADDTWIYASEGRSFLLPMVGLQLLAFRGWLRRRRESAALKAVGVFVIGLMAIHGVYAHAKLATDVVSGKPLAERSGAFGVITSLAMREESSLVVTDPQFRRYARLLGADTYTFTGLRSDSVWLAKPRNFLFAVSPSETGFVYKLFPKDSFTVVPSLLPYTLMRYERK